MFHMKQNLFDQYATLVRSWSKKHNIIGKIDPCELLDEAVSSLKTLQTRHLLSPLLVDVGAGAGMMGFAWVCSAPKRYALFVEPDRKSASFLQLLIASFPGLKGHLYLSDQRFERVPRETALSIHKDFFLVSRAFSPAEALLPLYKQSAFCSDPLYVYFNDRALPKGHGSVLQLQA